MIFLCLIGYAGYTGAKGLLMDDIEREKKWKEYEHREQ